MAQRKDLDLESMELNSQVADELEGLLTLLVELEIIEADKLSNGETPSASSTVSELDDSSSSQLPVEREASDAFPSLVEQSQFSLNSSPVIEHQEQEEVPEIPQMLEEQGEATSESISPKQDAEELNTLVELLQNLAGKKEDAELRHQIETLQQRLVKLENQIEQPTELLNLLLPLTAELLSLTVQQSRGAVTHSLTSIIDEVIDNRNQEDKVSMGVALAPAIPVAISHQISHSPEEVANAIAPEMASAIKQQIVLKRDALVDALYPIIGTTISTYIAQEIRAVNQKLENRLSLERITRKIRASLQGVSEGELLLTEAIAFRIRAIFLIHKGSGLVISEVQPSFQQRLESDMVAGMLTAIRSFVNDCITQSGDVAEIDAIDYGTSKIIFEVAGYCYLAVVIQGQPSQTFIQKMREALSTIVQTYGKPIELFEGDPATIPEQVNLILEALINNPTTLTQVKRHQPPALLVVGLVVLSIIFLPLGIYWYKARIARRVEDKTVLALAAAPELSVYQINVEAHSRTLRLSGRVPNQYLRSKAEQIAKATEPTLKLENNIIAVEVPPDPVLAASEVQRVTSILNQMDGTAITTRYADGSVTVEGKVTQVADARTITQAFQKIPGVRSVTNTFSLASLTIPTQIYFDTGAAELKPTDSDRKLGLVKDYLNRYPEKHLMIIGQTDPSGNPAENQQLALQRAKTVQDALVKQGIAPERTQVIGRAKSSVDVDANQPLWLSRSVLFELFTPTVKNK